MQSAARHTRFQPAMPEPDGEQPGDVMAKGADEALRASEARFRALAETAASAIWTVDSNGDLLDAPEARWPFLTDLPPEALAADWLAAVHPDDRARGNTVWWDAIAAGRPFAFEQRVRQRDGSHRHFAVRAVPVRGADGAIREWVGADIDITESKQTEEALRRGEERYRTLFESIDQGFCIIEMIAGDDGRPHDYRFEEVNPTFGRHTGLDDAVGRTARELAPGLEEHWFDIYGRVAETGEHYRFEQGSMAMGRWFEVEAVRVGGAGSRRVALLFSDVTERKRTEEALREGARQDAFRATLADALRPLSDPAAIQAEVSRVLGAHLGVTRAFFAEADADGEHVLLRQDYHHGVPSAVGRYRIEDFGAELAEAFRAGRTVVVDDVAAERGLSDEQRANYAAIAVRAHVTVCLVKQGRLVALLGVRQAAPRAWTASEVRLLDETAERTWAAVERANAETARRDHEERLQLGIDVAGFALLEVDYAAGVIHLSAEAARLYGLGDAAVTLPREQVHAAFHPDDRDELTRRIAIAPSRDDREPYTTEYRVVWPTGEVRWLSVRKQIVFADAAGPTPRPARAMLAALDITGRKEAEADRQALLDALAHDLRNPLTALKMQAQLLLRQLERQGMPDLDALTERVAGFEALAARMTTLIDELDDHARAATGHGIALDRAATDLVTLARDTLDEVRKADGSRILLLETDEPELVGYWDARLLRRVLENLLGNAVKYSAPDSEVRVRLDRHAGYAMIRVRDEGIGIPPADLPHVFTFRRRGGNVGAIEGSGVGLAGVKQIVDQHGGAVMGQSEEGRGSTFTVRLPLMTVRR